MLGYIYALTGAVFVGLNVFSIKLLSLYKEFFNEIVLFSLVTLLLSRVFIYWAMEHVSNPTIVNICLNCSTFVTFLLSLFILGIKDFHIGLFALGIFFLLLGLSCIQYSYQLKK
jgi:hypothetical protein